MQLPYIDMNIQIVSSQPFANVLNQSRTIPQKIRRGGYVCAADARRCPAKTNGQTFLSGRVKG